ncbi:MAG: SgcJ/EcaC family oxidoreductase [Chloroflexota bacterium]|nr:SgcJ/EcaC family oxidoreductase [Chloroflexota bacterium]
MRRFAALLSVAVFVLIGVSAHGADPTAVAQEASPAASPTALPPLLQRWLAALSTGDGEAVAALFAADGVYEDVPSGSVARGHDQIAALIDRLVAQERDFQLRLRAVHLTDDGAVLVYTATATDVESGQTLSMRGVTILEVDGDHIQRSADYYNVLGEDTAAATPAP